LSNPNGGPARRVWVDVTMLAACSTQPVGISRVLLTVLSEWSRGAFADLRLCRLDRAAGGFVEVAPDILQRFCRPPDTAAVPPARHGRLAPLKRYAKAVARPLKKFLPNPVKRLIKRKLRGYLRTAKGIAGLPGKVMREVIGRRPAAPATLIDLGPADVVVSLGEKWDFWDGATHYWRLKQTHGFRTAWMIYDLIPVLFPQFYGPGFGERYTHWLTDALWTTDLVLVGSESTRTDVQRFCLKKGVPVPPIASVRYGEDLPATGVPQPPAALARESGTPFVLCVGTVEARKNQILLYHVWRRLLERDGPEATPKLVIVGARGWMGQQVAYLAGTDPVTRDHILFLSGCGDAELRWLYENCLFTAYPSHYEGWGLPVAESLAYGKYCVAGNRSSIPEAGGGLIGLHDPDSVGQCLALVTAALDPAFRAARETDIRRGYRRRSWSECARQMADALAEAFGPAILKEAGDGAAQSSPAEHLPDPAARLGRTA
jgi:glycosyltransferase involved in cell wall biosynthesis